MRDKITIDVEKEKRNKKEMSIFFPHVISIQYQDENTLVHERSQWRHRVTMTMVW